MSLSKRRKHLYQGHQSNWCNKYEIEELEKSIFDDECTESVKEMHQKKPKLSLQKSDRIASKSWSTCSIGFTSKSPTKQNSQNNIESDYSNSPKKECDIIPESPNITPVKSQNNSLVEDTSNESPTKTQSQINSQNISEPNTPEAKHKEDKGTSWLQQIVWQPKPLEKEEDNTIPLLDSAKKKRPIKGGFSECLQKLERREKSSKSIWQLEKTKPTKKNNQKLLTLRVKKMETERGIFYAKCFIETAPPNLNSPNVNDNIETCTLVLNQNLIEEFSIKTDCSITIHPPLQIFKLATGNFIFPSPYLEVSQNTNQTFEADILETNLFKWKCPCTTTDIASNVCPLANGKLEEKHKFTLNNASPGVQPILKSIVESKASSSSETPNTSQLSQETKKSRFSILRAVEKVGGCDTQVQLANVQGRIENVSKHLSKWQLLIRDQDDVCCLLDVPTFPKNDSWSKIVENGIGCSYRFIGLIVSERLITERYPDILSVIKNVSKGCPDENIQPFIYVFNALNGDSVFKKL